MRGKICTYQSCPKCAAIFERVHLTDTITVLQCPTCRTTPSRFFIDLYDPHTRERYRISRDQYGHLLTSNDMASRLLEALRYDIDQHRFDPARYAKKKIEPYRFNVFCKAWLDHNLKRQEAGDLSWGAFKAKRGIANNHLLPYFGTKDIRDIHTMHVSEFRLQLKCGARTAKTVVSELSNLLRYALQLEMIERLPSIPDISFQRPPITVISMETQAKVLDAIEPYNQPLFRFMALTGCRPSMARALKWDCVDWERRQIVFKRNFSGERLTEVLKNRNVLYFPITSHIEEVLQSVARSITGFVFVSKEGRFYSHSLGRIWNRACRKVGVNIDLYSGVRHTFATHWLNEGVQLRDVSDLLGHGSVSVTLQNYAATNVRRLGDILEIKTGNKKERKNGH